MDVFRHAIIQRYPSLSEQEGLSHFFQLKKICFYYCSVA